MTLFNFIKIVAVLTFCTNTIFIGKKTIIREDLALVVTIENIANDTFDTFSLVVSSIATFNQDIAVSIFVEIESLAALKTQALNGDLVAILRQQDTNILSLKQHKSNRTLCAYTIDISQLAVCG